MLQEAWSNMPSNIIVRLASEAVKDCKNDLDRCANTYEEIHPALRISKRSMSRLIRGDLHMKAYIKNPLFEFMIKEKEIWTMHTSTGKFCLLMKIFSHTVEKKFNKQSNRRYGNGLAGNDQNEQNNQRWTFQSRTQLIKPSLYARMAWRKFTRTISLVMSPNLNSFWTT